MAVHSNTHVYQLQSIWIHIPANRWISTNCSAFQYRFLPITVHWNTDFKQWQSIGYKIFLHIRLKFPVFTHMRKFYFTPWEKPHVEGKWCHCHIKVYVAWTSGVIFRYNKVMSHCYTKHKTLLTHGVDDHGVPTSPLIWYATWPLSEKNVLTFVPHPMGRGCVKGFNICLHFVIMIIPMNLIYVTWPYYEKKV